ncbi:MAG: DUF6352 family protein [Burkholderiales bacterium]
MQDFWRNCGFNLLQRNAENHLLVTDDFLRRYLHRPELVLVKESCSAEIALHASLLDSPRQQVEALRLEKLADPDSRDNYRAWLNFRDRLLQADSVEACYLDIMRNGNRDVAPLFIDQMAQLIVRNILDGEINPLVVRAAECFFRAQSVNIHDGAVMAADAQTVDMYATTGGFGTLGKLLRETNTATRAVTLDVLNNDNAVLYWMRDERYDTVIDLTIGRPGITMLCGVLEKWLQHFLGVRASIKPVEKIHDANWAWHIGLDAESNMLLNDLYQGKSPDAADLKRLVGLFRLTFPDAGAVEEKLVGKPIYLGMAINAQNILRLKPQNLLLNLPLKAHL